MNTENCGIDELQAALAERTSDLESIKQQIRTAEVQQSELGVKMDTRWYMGAVKALAKAKADVKILNAEIQKRIAEDKKTRVIEHVFMRIAKKELDKSTYERLLDECKREISLRSKKHD